MDKNREFMLYKLCYQMQSSGPVSSPPDLSVDDLGLHSLNFTTQFCRATSPRQVKMPGPSS